MKDPVPRVVSHVLAAIGNVFEGSEPDVIKKYSQNLLKNIYLLIESNNIISLVKECAISVISACAESMKSEFSVYAPEYVKHLLNIVQKYN